MSETGHIFISYARRDGQPFVERLEGALQARGYTTWRDIRGIDPAKDFTAEIERAIKAAEVVVTCITPDTERDDSFVRREIQYALVVGKRVIVARMAEIAPPIHVVNNTWVEFWRDWDKGFEHLITVLNTPVENYTTPALPPETADPFRPYVQTLYERTVDFLDRAVIRLIDLSSEETPEAVNAPPRQPSMIDLFFTAQGIPSHPTSSPPGPLSASQRGGAKAFSTFAEAFNAYDGRVLLLGEPGAGKTITLMAFARDAAAKRLADPNAPLPLLGLISSWDAEKQAPLAEWLAAGVGGVKPEEVKREIERGTALLLLDGLDELGGERDGQDNPLPASPEHRGGVKYDPRKRFMEQLPANNQILITCRVKDYEEIGQKIALKGAVTLRPLDDVQMQSYLAEQPELWAAVQADEKLKEMLTTPLLLSFFAFAYRDDLDGTERQQLANLSDSPGDLRDKIFETYVQKRYEHEARKYAARGEAMPFSLHFMNAYLGLAAMMNVSGYRWIKSYPNTQDDILMTEDMAIIDYILFPWTNTSYSNLGVSSVNMTIEDIKEELASFDIQHIQLLIELHIIVRFHDLGNGAYSYRFNHILLRNMFAYNSALSFLSHLHSIWRQRAAIVLGRLRDRRAVNVLCKAIKDSDPTVREKLCRALKSIGDSQAADTFFDVFTDKYENPETRTIAVEGLHRVGDPRASYAAESVEHDLSFSPRQRLRAAAVRSVDKTRGVSLGTFLQLGDEKTFFHELSTWAEEIESRYASEDLEYLLKDKSLGKEDIIFSGVLLAMRGDKRAIPVLINVVKDTNQDLLSRSIAAQYLADFHDDDVLNLMVQLVGSEHDTLRASSALNLGEYQDSDVLKALHKLVQDQDTDVRMYAASSLGNIKIKDEQSVFLLIKTLEDKIPSVRGIAAEALGILGESSAVERLIELLDDMSGDVYGRVCDDAAKALERISTPEALEAVRVWREQQAGGGE